MEGRPPDDTELTRRAKQGDTDAYAMLVRRHQPAVLRLAYVLCGDDTDAADAAQDAFVKAYRALDRFRDGSPFRPWILQIAANEARNRSRARGRRRQYELAIAGERASGEAAPSPEAAVLLAERRRAVVDALALLPGEHREVVACRHLLGLSEAETASVLGLPRGTVKSRLAHALERLRTSLSDEGAPDG